MNTFYTFSGTIWKCQYFLSILWNHLKILTLFINSLKPSENMNTSLSILSNNLKYEYFLSILWNNLKYEYFLSILSNHLKIWILFINSLEPSENIKTFYQFSETIWKYEYFFINSLEPSEIWILFINSLEPSEIWILFINSLEQSENMNTFYQFSETIWKY